MRKSLSTNLLLLMPLILTACGNGPRPNSINVPTPTSGDPSADHYRPRPSQKPEQVLIYIDLTSSIKPDGVIRISEKLKTVLLSLPRASVANIRLVEKNLLGESPFEALESPAGCVVEESEIDRVRIEAQKACDKASEPYIKKINEIVARVQTLKPKMDVSCIIDTLESAHDFFKVKDSQHSAFRLIYFSDMIEQCPSSSIYICSRTAQPRREEIEAKINASFHPTFNLESVLGPNLSIIITASDNPGVSCLSLSEQKEIWRDVFSKVGYHDLDISGFNFTQEIPEILLR